VDVNAEISSLPVTRGIGTRTVGQIPQDWGVKGAGTDGLPVRPVRSL